MPSSMRIGRRRHVSARALESPPCSPKRGAAWNERAELDHVPMITHSQWATMRLLRSGSARNMVCATIGPKPMHQEVESGDEHNRHCLCKHRAPVHYVVQDQRQQQDDRLASGTGKVVAKQPHGETAAMARKVPEGQPIVDGELHENAQLRASDGGPQEALSPHVGQQRGDCERDQGRDAARNQECHHTARLGFGKQPCEQPSRPCLRRCHSRRFAPRGRYANCVVRSGHADCALVRNPHQYLPPSSGRAECAASAPPPSVPTSRICYARRCCCFACRACKRAARLCMRFMRNSSVIVSRMYRSDRETLIEDDSAV